MVGHIMPIKWFIDGYSGYGLGLTLVWDVQKYSSSKVLLIPKYGTKDPNYKSNSWGYRAINSSAYAFSRTGAPIQYTQ